MRRRHRQTLVRVVAATAAVIAGVAGYQYLVTSGPTYDVGCYARSGSSGPRLTRTTCDEPHSVEMIGYVDRADDRKACRALAEQFIGGPLTQTRVGTLFLTTWSCPGTNRRASTWPATSTTSAATTP